MKKHLIKFWLPLAIASTIIMLAVYATAQQSIRLSANDPQIQMAEDGAIVLEAGMAPYVLVGNAKVDMQKSSAPFVIIYSDSGKVVGSSGYINGQVPVLPAGVLDYARNNFDDRITWQPASTTRIAAVVKHFGGKNPGFIVSGRNLRDIEARESQLALIIGAAWLGLIVLTFIAVLYPWVVERKEVEGLL